MEQVNELLRAELASLIGERVEFIDGLITVVRVKCSPNLHDATIFVSVLPETKNGSALNALRRASQGIAKELPKRIKLKYIPKLNWRIDPTEAEADVLEKAILEISK